LQVEVAALKKQMTRVQTQLMDVRHEAARSVERLEEKVKKMR
jgi:hypothetical protein